MVRASAVVRALLVAAFGSMGVLHFTPSAGRGMAAMVPRRIVGRPFSAKALVRITGACEIAGAAGLLLPRTRSLAGACLVVFLAAVFPANAVAAAQPERFGRIAVPFWPRLAGQVAMAAAVAFAALSPAGRARGGR